MNTALLGDVEEHPVNPIWGMSITYIFIAIISGITTVYMTTSNESLAILSGLTKLSLGAGPNLKLTETLLISFGLVVAGLLLTNSGSTPFAHVGGLVLTVGWSSVVTPMIVNYLLAVESLISIYEGFTFAALSALSVIATGIIYLSRRFTSKGRRTNSPFVMWIIRAFIATSMLAVFIPELSTLALFSVSGLITALWLVGRISVLTRQGNLGETARDISLNCLLVTLLFTASTMVIVGLAK